MNDTMATDQNNSIILLSPNISDKNNFSNISAPTTSATVTLTPVELWIQILFFYIFFCGIVTNIMGTAIWIGILRKKDLRTRFFIIIGFLTFCRTGSCTNLLISGIFRALRTAGIVDTFQRRLFCHSLHFWLLDGFVLEQALLLALVIDRMIALMAINYYRLLTDRSAAYVCIILYAAVTVIVIGPSYAFDDMWGYAPCINTDSFVSPIFNLYKTNLSLAVVCAIVVCYCVLIFYVRLGAKAMEADAQKSEIAKVALQRQLKLMPIFRNVVLMHCGFTFSSRLLNMLAPLFPPEYGQRLTGVGGIFMNFDLFFNMMTLLVNNADIRKAAIPWWRKDYVTPFQGTGSGSRNTQNL